MGPENLRVSHHRQALFADGLEHLDQPSGVIVMAMAQAGCIAAARFHTQLLHVENKGFDIMAYFHEYIAPLNAPGPSRQR
jgi:hypothetical protein